jgi:cation transport ATPase
MFSRSARQRSSPLCCISRFHRPRGVSRARVRRFGAVTALAPAPPFELELSVTGMTCAACAARVQKQLGKLDGVSATVNLATEKATVRLAAPVPVETLIAQVEKAGYGASLAAAPQSSDDRVRDLWRRLVVAMLIGVPLADLSITLVLVPSLRFPGWQWVLLAMTLPVVTWSAWPFHRKAVVAARHGGSSMDTLVSLGVTAAAVWSIFTIFNDGDDRTGHGAWGLLFQPGGSIYLDVAVGVTVFVLAGRLLEAKARRAAGDALRALARVGAKQATRLRDDDSEELVPASAIRVGDRLVVRPGETIAADGVVLSGSSAVDTSAMTGESVPATVTSGDTVTGGTVAVAGRLIVEARRVGSETQLAQLVKMVERAQTEKARVQRLADRISSVFVPVVIVLAALTGAAWALGGASAERAVSVGLAVLIIACPCALGLATPTALLAASGRGARLGLFIKGQQALESARAIDTVVLDKTGTVTTGRMRVAEVWLAPGATRDAVLGAAGAVENAAEHVIGRVVAAYALRETGSLPPVDDFEALPGLGARGTVDGRRVVVGSPRLLAPPTGGAAFREGAAFQGDPAFRDEPALQDEPALRDESAFRDEDEPALRDESAFRDKPVLQGDLAFRDEPAFGDGAATGAPAAEAAVRRNPGVGTAVQDGQGGGWAERFGGATGTVVLVSVDGEVCGGLLLTDTVKPSAAGAVRALREMGLRTVLLTGDNAMTAEAVGEAVGVDEVIAEVLPAGKAETIARLQAEGRVVAMVGDGVNDAPALARADLGLAVLTGTDVAIGAADVILVRDDLDVVPAAIALARRTLATIRVNLVWAFGYNVLALPIAAAGLLNPLISSAAMALSSLLVVSNSLRLRR